MNRTILPMLVLCMFAGCADTDLISPSAATPVANVNPPQQKSVVTFTDTAASKAMDFKRATDLPYLRVSVSLGGCSGFMYDLHFDDQIDAENDFIDESRGLKIVVDQESALYIDGTAIEWQVTDDGREGFHFNNPNAVKP